MKAAFFTPKKNDMSDMKRFKKAWGVPGDSSELSPGGIFFKMTEEDQHYYEVYIENMYHNSVKAMKDLMKAQSVHTP